MSSSSSSVEATDQRCGRIWSKAEDFRPPPRAMRKLSQDRTTLKPETLKSHTAAGTGAMTPDPTLRDWSWRSYAKLCG